MLSLEGMFRIIDLLNDGQSRFPLTLSEGEFGDRTPRKAMKPSFPATDSKGALFFSLKPPQPPQVRNSRRLDSFVFYTAFVLHSNMNEGRFFER